MANTISRGETVDHVKVAACNETMLLVSQLEKRGWTHKDLDQHFDKAITSPGTAYAWSRGNLPATSAQRTEMKKLLKASKKRRAEEFDHSPKTPEEAAKHDAEREAAMIKAHGTTNPVKVDGPKKPRAPKRTAPTEDKRVITVLAKENPKRPGSKAHARFALYRNGMTVEQFLAAGGTSADIAFDMKHNFIQVE